jgi:hypothetical protein
LKKKNSPEANNTDTLLKLYQIYDNHRNAILWFLEEGLDAKDYNEYGEKYSGAFVEILVFLLYRLFPLRTIRSQTKSKRHRNRDALVGFTLYLQVDGTSQRTDNTLYSKSMR